MSLKLQPLYPNDTLLPPQNSHLLLILDRDGLHRSVAERSYSTFKVRRGGGEELPLGQGKEQQLRFAGAAVKRHPTSKIRETQVRW